MVNRWMDGLIEIDRIYMKVDKRYDHKCLLLLLGY